jgi:hypothetical protein
VLSLLPDLDGLDLSVWTPVAQRPRFEGNGKWIKVPGAPFSLRQARKLMEAGKLLLALAFTDEVETVVVKRPRAAADSAE